MAVTENAVRPRGSFTISLVPWVAPRPWQHNSRSTRLWFTRRQRSSWMTLGDPSVPAESRQRGGERHAQVFPNFTLARRHWSKGDHEPGIPFQNLVDAEQVMVRYIRPVEDCDWLGGAVSVPGMDLLANAGC